MEGWREGGMEGWREGVSFGIHSTKSMDALRAS